MKTTKLGLGLIALCFLSSMCLGQKLKTGAPGATAPKTGEKVAVFDTNLGRIIVKFFPKIAPKTVANFEKLAGKGFYNDVAFHRAVPGFMIQGGDPNTKQGATGSPGTGGPGYTIDDEFTASMKHTRGVISMAHTGAPNSAGSQFFIMVAAAPFLDGQYAAFGIVVQGMDVVDKIVNLPRQGEMLEPRSAVMKKVKITTWPVK